MPLLEYIRHEWSVLKKAPLTFLILAGLLLAVGFRVGRAYDNDRLAQKDDELRRYRVALGVEPGSPNALVELTNPELQNKALIISLRVRELCGSFNKRSADIKSQLDAKKIDEEGAWDRQQALMKEVSAEFDREIRSDALNVQNELLRRLDPKAAGAVVRFPVFYDAQTGAPISLFSLLPRGFGGDAAFLCGFADELEQLARLLPAR